LLLLAVTSSDLFQTEIEAITALRHIEELFGSNNKPFINAEISASWL
jgi:hypothetical protein